MMHNNQYLNINPANILILTQAKSKSNNLHLANPSNKENQTGQENSVLSIMFS